MKAFVTGATGYIGFNVALALRRAGHEVWGLAHHKEKAQVLGENEIRPVLGSMEEPQGYRSIAELCSLLVHTASDPGAERVGLDKKTVETLLSLGKSGAQPKTVIYTSGVWVHGNTGCNAVDETAPLNPPKLVAWRPGIEQLVLNSRDVRGLVIRPACVYGKQGGLTGLWFGGAAKEKTFRVIGDGTSHWAMVHVDDLAEGYLLAAESPLQGEVFNLADASRSTVLEMASAAAKAAGSDSKTQLVPLAEAAKSMGDFAECLALDQHIDASKAARLLGWQPKHQSFVAEIATYFESWRAQK
jgi:nucleoside-diphosphate-sugar epimerase